MGNFFSATIRLLRKDDATRGGAADLSATPWPKAASIPRRLSLQKNGGAEGWGSCDSNHFESHAPIPTLCTSHRQRGAATVEFALVAMVFFTLLIGIMEFGRILFAFNSAAEATRFGARVAAVCNPNSQALILAKMQYFMPALTTAQASINYLPSGCDASSCTQVQVKVTGISYRPMIPVADLTISMPPFTTTLPRESLQSTVGGNANPECS